MVDLQFFLLKVWNVDAALKFLLGAQGVVNFLNLSASPFWFCYGWMSDTVVLCLTKFNEFISKIK